jgi:hypothetical protein
MNISNIEKIEEKLGRSLIPIQPNNEFVNRLQKRLVPQKTIQIEKDSIRFAIVSTFLGLFIGVLIVWILRRIT